MPMTNRGPRAKSLINKTLLAATGYELHKRSPAEVSIKRSHVTDPLPGKTGRKLPVDYDMQAVEIIRSVSERTMTGHEKLYGLISAVRYITRYGIPGDIVECGVWRGGSMQAAVLTLTHLGESNRTIWLYDTFDGMTTPTAEDVRYDGESAASRLESADKSSSNIWAYASLEDVQAGFAGLPYPDGQIRFVKGPIEQTIPAQRPNSISILRLDTDWYQSTKHELRHLWDLLSPGGVLIIDDYGWWQGSKKATDDFMLETGAKLLLTRLGGSGRIAVKPGLPA